MLHQTPPGGGQNRGPSLHWVNRKVKRGTGYDGWKAGPCAWYTCHTDTRPTKPCLKAVTGGAIPCPKCGTKEEVMGYFPLWTHTDSAPVLALIHETDRERIDAIPLHQAVHVFREDREDAGISITPYLSKNFARFTTALAEKMKPADITRALIKIWGIPALAEWFNAQRANSDNPVTLATEAQPAHMLAKHIENIREGKHSDAATYTGALLGDAVGDALARRNEQWAAEARKTSRNGKHKPPLSDN